MLIYYPASGELAINAETKGERWAYCRYLGKHLFGDAEFFRFENPLAHYTLQPLIDLGRDALICRGVEGMEHACLVELHIAHESDQADVEVRRADDVFLALENQRRRLQDEEAATALPMNMPRSGAATISPSGWARFCCDIKHFLRAGSIQAGQCGDQR